MLFFLFCVQGSSSKILHLTNLDEGTYRFQLTVTDRKGQTDKDDATVIVKPGMCERPEAVTVQPLFPPPQKKKKKKLPSDFQRE